MSGGSFGYLCNRELAEVPEDLLRMRDALPEGSAARARTDEIIKAHEKIHELAGSIWDASFGIRDVWKALEWWHSSDWGEEHFLEAINKYEENNVC